ncbi:MAG: KH domain-containing protein [Candidatus Curtissbacteria bacterium]|nr:KH domain-containing protein [Candidatus Curtissbacteria bacterium]
MEDLIKLLIEPLVSDINKVRIEKQENEQAVTFNVFVPKDEIAKVIGKEGKMVKSIKNLVKIRAIKENVFAHLEVQEA